MNKAAPATAVAAVFLLVLAGCSSTGRDTAQAPQRTSAAASPSQLSASPPRVTASASAAPIRTATPKPSPPRSIRTSTPPPGAVFSSSVSTITPAIQARMPYSWRPGCPVGLADLRYLTVSYRGFDRVVHRGELVVHENQANNVVRALQSMFNAGVLIRQMRLVDVYHADDDASVTADNTSAFNCREVAGRPGVWSQHSYGVAIDFNPLENPYVHSDGSVDISASRPYADRSLRATGMIHSSDATVDALAAIGWKWGGYWSSVKDYQHFSSTGR